MSLSRLIVKNNTSRSTFLTNKSFTLSIPARFAHGGNLEKEVSLWYWISMGTIAVLLGTHAFILSVPEEEQERKEYPFMRKVSKPFPWRDGKLPLFGDAEARRAAHHGHSEHH